MIKLRSLFFACLAVLPAACEERPIGAVGQLLSERVEITAEIAEAIVSIEVSEGSRVEAGAVLLTQNDERIQARLAEVQAEIGRVEALLAEQLQGPRLETLQAARAEVEERRIEYQYRVRELERLDELRARNLTSVESIDLARKTMETANASLTAFRARLQELEAGTRSEQLQQTRFSLQQARARLQQLQIERARHVLRAPSAAVVDSLPFEVGERPATGTVVAVLLGGEQPFARVYLPEAYRVNVAPGDPVRVYVDGLAQPLDGSVRWVASEASFTPYFALTEGDRSRLTYLAEITLPALPDRLPDGVPVEAFFQGMSVPDHE
jgi:HlyD family secretion protein